MKKVAIIPARGGSKRIYKKNIKLFLDKPIIAYSIDAAIKSNLFDEIMVSTDDDEIAAISKNHGASVPFLRSKKNSDDYATTVDVIQEVLSDYAKRNEKFDSFCCIYPTAPLITANRLNAGYHMLQDGAFDSVFPIVPFNYPIQRALKTDGKRVEMIWPENYNSRSQDLPKSYHDAGQFYWMGVDRFLNEKKIFSGKSGYIELTELESQDINTDFDWELAEFKYKLLYAKV